MSSLPPEKHTRILGKGTMNKKTGKRTFWELTFKRMLTQEEQMELYNLINERFELVRFSPFELDLAKHTPPAYTVLRDIFDRLNKELKQSLTIIQGVGVEFNREFDLGQAAISQALVAAIRREAFHEILSMLYEAGYTGRGEVNT